MSGLCSAHQGHDPSCRLCRVPVPGERGYHAKRRAWEREQEALKGHACQRPADCSCPMLALEPAERCPIHGAGEWPPRCALCGRLMPWPLRSEDKGKP